MRCLYLVLLLSLSVFVPQNTDAATLHTVVVCDTTENDIGYSTKRDCERVQREVQKIAYLAEMNLNYKELSGYYAQTRKVWDTLRQLRVAEDDVVVFYFSGHGIHRYSEQGTRWPDLYFSLEDRAIPLGNISDAINKKNPRFALIVSDSCNNFVDDEDAPRLAIRKALVSLPQMQERRIDAYKKLFRDVKGTIICVGAIEGGYALAGNNGGSFTIALFDILNRNLFLGNSVEWENILLTVRDQLINSGVGIPDYSIEFGN